MAKQITDFNNNNNNKYLKDYTHADRYVDFFSKKKFYSTLHA